MGPTVVILLWVVLFMLMGALLGMNMYMVSERTGADTYRRRASRDRFHLCFSELYRIAFKADADFFIFVRQHQKLSQKKFGTNLETFAA